MRNYREMINLITEIAKEDERIRGVYLNGSRTNPNAVRDVFQDYDIVYVVSETASFIEDENWIKVFGEIMYMQLPDKIDRMKGMETDWENCYGYLMQLADGNRIDLHIVTLKYAIRDICHDRLCIVYLDKDKKLPVMVEPTDEDHWVKRPTKEEFLSCCNEFWWSLNSIGKGLWRGEITYVMDCVNMYSRPQLMLMLSWCAGIHTDFTCSIGKAGKYLNNYISQEEYERFLQTYPQANLDIIWQVVFDMCDFFEEMAKKAGKALGYSYNEKEAHNSRLFLDCTYEIPKDAEEVRLVRRMRQQDIDEVGRIWLEVNIAVHSFIPEEYWQINYDMVKRQLAETEIYVYEDNNGIQGFVGIDKGYIKGIFVREEMRNKGIGKDLMYICKSKYFKMNLHIYCQNTKAMNFYMREGFIISRKMLDKNTDCAEYEMTWRKEER